MNANLFQVTVDLGYNKSKNLDKFEKYLESFNPRDYHAKEISHEETRGRHSDENHVSYEIRFRENAEMFAEEVDNTGLAEQVYIYKRSYTNNID